MPVISATSSQQRDRIPLVSIGMPIYNSIATLQRVLDSLLAQSLIDFELIISDNGSTDGSEAMCAAYAAKDARLRYIRQPVNIGAAPNFKFVLDQARGPYFLWAAGDDIRSPDFLEENVTFLQAHPDYVASTSPNCFEGQDPGGPAVISFAMDAETAPARFVQFFEHSMKSHGIFYAVTRTAVLRECEVVGQSFIAFDWCIDLFLASRGKIFRTKKGLTIFGVDGMSSRPNAYRAFRNRRIEVLLPYYRLSLYTWRLCPNFSIGERVSVLVTLMKLNAQAVYDQTYSTLYQFYCAHLKSWLKPIKTK